MRTWKAHFVAPLAAALSLTGGGCSMFGGEAADEPDYSVVEQVGDVEIREYDGFTIAETTVQAPFDEATGAGFRRLFGYISGGNRRQTKIEMTAPVLTEPDGEKITMTAPILAQPGKEAGESSASSLTPEGIESWTTAFVLPKGFTAVSAPVPEDPRVSLRDIPPRRVASIRFAGRFRNATAEMKRPLLVDWLASRGLSHSDDWRFAGYNPPWTLPALRRNEVQVTLE